MLTTPADLTIGLHTKSVTVGASSTNLSLPGVGRAENDSDYFLIVVADPRDLISESDADAFNEDNVATFIGSYHVPVLPATTGPVFVHSSPSADTIVAQPGGTSLLLNGTPHTLVASVSSLRIRVHAGNDSVDLSTMTRPVFVLGASGDDMLIGGSGNDYLHGGTGNDTIQGKGGSDTMIAGSGDDVLRETADANMTVTNSQLITVIGLVTETNPISMFERLQLVGGISTNVINASAFTSIGVSTFEAGGGGDDTIIGTNSNDVLTGGPGRDSLSGLGGNDFLFGGAGRDTLLAGDGDDRAFGQGASFDSVSGGNGNDTVKGGVGDDIVNGDAGNDQVEGEDGIDTLHGNDGADTVDGGLGNDSIFGDAGNDRLLGQDGNDFLNGGADADSILGHAGNDTLIGEAGNDTLTGAAGTDSFDGGAGTDRVVETADSNFTIIGVQIISVATGTETPIGIERITINGGASGNRIDGRQATVPLILNGLDGNDSISGGNQNDLLFGGNGNDLLNGREGNDSLEGGDGNDGLSGYTGNDALRGDAGTDTLFGHDGSDQLFGGIDNDSLIGGGGTSVSGDGPDTLQGDAGSDSYRADSGDTFVTDAFDTIIPGLFASFPSWVDQI